jgi:alpha-L-fucosidase
MREILSLFMFVFLCGLNVMSAQNVAVDQMTSENSSKMSWWKNAKFGMFIHWGLYSQSGGIWKGNTSYAEWLMNDAKIPRAEYAAVAKDFNPVKFNAEEWVKLAKAAGQKYIVITSKHHEGFAMFKTAASKYNIYDATPFKRDVIDEMAKACRKYGMKLGLYYSQAQDWYNVGGGMYCDEWDETHKGDMEKYIDEIAIPQVKEILSKYGDIAVLWWDTPAKMTEGMAKKLHAITEQYPNLITNNRLGGGIGGDLETPEQYIPATGFPGRNWEVCMTMNDHWGYNAYDSNWKTTKELIRKLTDIVSKGGNFLLNVGPNRYGEIPAICQKELHEIGDWLNVNGEAVYGTKASPFPYLPFGNATQKGNTIYFNINDWNKVISVPYPMKIVKAYLLEDKSEPVKSYVKDGYTYFKLPSYAPDKIVSVLAVECKSSIPTQIAPSSGATITADGKPVKELNDNNMNSKYEASGSKAVIEINLEKANTIRCMSMVEPWFTWDNKSQSYTLEAQENGNWVNIASGKTGGTGLTVPFKDVNAKTFRITLTNTTAKAAASEILLFN